MEAAGVHARGRGKSPRSLHRRTGAAAAGIVRRAGARRAVADRQRSRDLISRDQRKPQGARNRTRGGGPPPPRSGIHRAGHLRDGRLRPADRLRERHQRHARPRQHTAAGDGGQDRAGRLARADHPAVARRASRAVRVGQRDRRTDGRLRHRVDHQFDPGREQAVSPQLRSADRRPRRPAVCTGDRRHLRRRLRAGAGVVWGADGCQSRPARWSLSHDDQPNRDASAKHARHRRGLPGTCAAHQRRLARPDVPQYLAHRHRIRSAAAVDVPDHARPAEIRR